MSDKSQKVGIAVEVNPEGRPEVGAIVTATFLERGEMPVPGEELDPNDHNRRVLEYAYMRAGHVMLTFFKPDGSVFREINTSEAEAVMLTRQTEETINADMNELWTGDREGTFMLGAQYAVLVMTTSIDQAMHMANLGLIEKEKTFEIGVKAAGAALGINAVSENHQPYAPLHPTP